MAGKNRKKVLWILGIIILILLVNTGLLTFLDVGGAEFDVKNDTWKGWPVVLGEMVKGGSFDPDPPITGLGDSNTNVEDFLFQACGHFVATLDADNQLQVQGFSNADVTNNIILLDATTSSDHRKGCTPIALAIVKPSWPGGFDNVKSLDVDMTGKLTLDSGVSNPSGSFIVKLYEDGVQEVLFSFRPQTKEPNDEVFTVSDFQVDRESSWSSFDDPTIVFIVSVDSSRSSGNIELDVFDLDIELIDDSQTGGGGSDDLPDPEDVINSNYFLNLWKAFLDFITFLLSKIGIGVN